MTLACVIHYVNDNKVSVSELVEILSMLHAKFDQINIINLGPAVTLPKMDKLTISNLCQDVSLGELLSFRTLHFYCIMYPNIKILYLNLSAPNKIVNVLTENIPAWSQCLDHLDLVGLGSEEKEELQNNSFWVRSNYFSSLSLMKDSYAQNVGSTLFTSSPSYLAIDNVNDCMNFLKIADKIDDTPIYCNGDLSNEKIANKRLRFYRNNIYQIGDLIVKYGASIPSNKENTAGYWTDETPYFIPINYTTSYILDFIIENYHNLPKNIVASAALPEKSKLFDHETGKGFTSLRREGSYSSTDKEKIAKLSLSSEEIKKYQALTPYTKISNEYIVSRDDIYKYPLDFYQTLKAVDSKLITLIWEHCADRIVFYYGAQVNYVNVTEKASYHAKIDKNGSLNIPNFNFNSVFGDHLVGVTKKLVVIHKGVELHISENREINIM